MNKLNEQSYEAPKVTVIEFEVEKGFAISDADVKGWDDGGEFEGFFNR